MSDIKKTTIDPRQRSRWQRIKDALAGREYFEVLKFNRFTGGTDVVTYVITDDCFHFRKGTLREHSKLNGWRVQQVK